jgi:hypothetical protein
MPLPSIRTSYFARSGSASNAVAITVYKPRWLFSVAHYPDLAPPKGLLDDYKKKRISARDYVEVYLEELDLNRELNPRDVACDLDQKILCCYECCGDFCHRHLVAYWLRHHRVAIVTEILRPGEKVYDPIVKGIL